MWIEAAKDQNFKIKTIITNLETPSRAVLEKSAEHHR
jgi:hypothetical protein